MSIFQGSAVAIVTPFNETGVDFKKLEELLEWHVKEGTDAIVICGTTGEATTMTEKEIQATIKFTVDVINKRIPVIAGTGSNNTASAISMSKYAEAAGADGLLVITPYYNKTTQKGLIKHFSAINAEVKTPIIIYNVPSRTGVNVTPGTLHELSKLNNIVGIKEASGNISQVVQMKALCKDSIDIYSGNDDQIVAIMALGGKGVISVLANIIPNKVHEMAKNCLNNNFKEALDIQLDTLALTNTLFVEINPIPIKTAMNLIGFKVGELRLPLCEMEVKNEELLKAVLKENKLM
ncbi:4-hydroxy-tetrahydrodipicolinate synthase [Clostridium saccharoperbutylacetonicum]|jgi:4-hydroxy-tetrahydrodipicolinate synthase|uniref:4-hydroxy-tetrahydrodipicolinate synthase n=1 Tax=Clostridium saccharoperbutylacetonicum N1-4(HMT) TaxID=931276 RepID=M1MLN7_9CLOT|nr:4-hydroxy-tetrahydrodipicolinate synthase [Clostridium saccharoperbutylacetonicum]AGF57153.1 dihydrodipicolinate synthase DapA [Clostridium saccharoperbutylacetonicum N1-4(HMT)]NRT62088.1 4-hydroxy-tetrahydrodipicolinate synthase [Clostridium saccharoperbutylacetonicum]NSB25418.1 4-hydroxy-tetrahydrodipicolinate synthase [Clostridium saccharoperbutylacetonicum]NSB44787.1 4-hydroxy-tetrahydrodipicolinate synthase [Clostridium saccharoperbutylacetonicum]